MATHLIPRKVLCCLFRVPSPLSPPVCCSPCCCSLFCLLSVLPLRPPIVDHLTPRDNGCNFDKPTSRSATGEAEGGYRALASHQVREMLIQLGAIRWIAIAERQGALGMAHGERYYRQTVC